LDELPGDQAMANLYAQGNRWVVVFSDATGPRGDCTFIHIDSFDAGAMMANRLKEVDALQELADMGYRLQDLPGGIQLRAAGTSRARLVCRPDPTLPAAVLGWPWLDIACRRWRTHLHRSNLTPNSARMWRWCWTKPIAAEDD
jgi:hypothetical protein